MAESQDDQQEGYDVEFVDKISTDEITCAICLHILREPVQAVPCGHRFCKFCINKVKKQGSKKSKSLVCPIDRRKVEIFPDVGREREILNHQVKCTYSKLSCQWTGDLRNLQIHLEGCQFLLLECELKCGKNVLKNQMLHHLETECPKNMFPCKYAKIGCQVRGNKAFLLGHLKENTDEHLTLQIEGQQKHVAQLNKIITQHKEKVLKLEKILAQNQGKASKRDETLAQQKERVTKLEKTLAQHKEKASKREKTLALYNEKASKRDETLAQHNETITMLEEALTQHEQNTWRLELKHQEKVTNLEKTLAQQKDQIEQLEEKPVQRSYRVYVVALGLLLLGAIVLKSPGKK